MVFPVWCRWLLTDRQAGRQIVRKICKQKGRKAERKTEKKTGREENRKEDRQRGGHKDWTVELRLTDLVFYSPSILQTCYFNIFHKPALSSLSTAAADHFLQPKSCSKSIPSAYLDKYVQSFSFISSYMTFVLWYCWRTLAPPSVEPVCRAVVHSSPELDCWGRTRLL